MGRNTAITKKGDLAQALDGSSSVVRPLLILVLMTLALLFAVLFYGAHSADVAAQAREAGQINSYVRQHRLTLESALDSAAAENSADYLIDNSNAAANFQRHVHGPLAMIAQVDQTFLIGPDGQLILWSGDSQNPAQAHPDNINQLVSTADLSIDRLRAVSDFMILDDMIHIVAARAMTCQNGQTCLLASTTNVSVALQESMETGWGLGHFRAQAKTDDSGDMFSAPIKSATNDTIGWYVWRATRPGQDLLLEYMPWLTIIAIGVVVVASLVWRRARDVTQEVLRQQQEANHRALHDPLTGLANRALLNARTEAALADLNRNGKGFALHLIDLDRFKDVNDTLGHQAGDELIQQAALRLQGVCRAGDTVARLGGDEFAIIQLDVNTPAAAGRLARRAVEQLANVYKIASSEAFVSGSIGVTICNDGELDRTELTRQADIALYRAKDAGRNQFCFFEADMDRSLQEKRLIETELRAAMSDGCDQLHVVYQPQVSSDGRNIRGMEALIRWTHPTRGVMSPAEFVPIAEETGLIRQLGEYVMRESMRTARDWPDVTMAVNVSAAELQTRDYASRVISMADAEGVRTDQIELEITETVLLEDSARVTRTIKQLKAAGFRIALDDFGTGYSSLSYLRRHQVDKLKIDQSFVSSIGVRDDASAVVQAIIHLGEALGLTVTAEGVETETQREALRTQGCAYLQGYLFSRPLNRDQISDMMDMFRDQAA